MSDSQWIEWSGAECPVDEFTPCEIRLRATEEIDGKTRHMSIRTVRPHEMPPLWAWTHTGDNRDSDVIAYRLIHHPFLN